MHMCLQRFNAYKYHWSDKRVPVILEVNPASLDQVDPATRRTICSYDYKDIEGFAVVRRHLSVQSELEVPLFKVTLITF